MQESTDASPDTGPDGGLAELFRAVGGRLRRLSLQSLAPLDISPSQARALGVLDRHGAIRLSELSEHLRIAARSATEVVDGLEERGLVRRQPDPDDRRATLVTVTEHGTETAEAIRRARGGDALRFFGGLDQADQDDLRRILRALMDEPRSTEPAEQAD